MNFEVALLEDYVSRGLINKQKHPEKNIWIYNYTPECVYEKKWDEITIQCRGLILDGDGKVIARPFKKFWNYSEPEAIIPNGVPKIFKKMDGSLIIVFRYDGETIVATRGSFVSDQAKLAKEMLFFNERLLYMVNSIENQFTWLFELIGPSNRIVVAYPQHELVLLAVVSNYSGSENSLDYYRNYNFINVVEEYKAEWNENTIKYLQSMNISNEEGFVLKWNDGYRVKIKFDDYFRLHKLITGLNEKAIWEFMRDGKCVDEIVKNVPEEFRKWVEEVAYRLWEVFNSTKLSCRNFIDNNSLKRVLRKDSAILIMQEYPSCQSVLFLMLDEKEKQAEESIWKLIKPKTNKFFKEIIREEI